MIQQNEPTLTHDHIRRAYIALELDRPGQFMTSEERAEVLETAKGFMFRKKRGNQ